MIEKLQHRVVQAPMAGTSTPALAVAVCEAGGMGFVAAGAIDATATRTAIEQVRTGTSRPFGVNLFCHQPARRDAAVEEAWLNKLRPEFAAFGAEPPSGLREIYQSFRVNDDMLRMLIEVRPAIVSFHFGLATHQQIAALKGAGCELWATATSAEEGQRIKAAGLDRIVAQGWQAGGHRGTFEPSEPDMALGTLDLVRALQPSGLPVIAAGAIMDRRDAQAAMDAGAVAVQCGTAFLLSPEAATPPAHRSAMSGGRTQMTRAISGRYARCLENRFTAIDDTDAPDYPVTYDAGKALHAAASAKGEMGYGAFWAGTEAARAVSRPAAETVAAISP
ncbi:nitronate monooxygenase [Paracoccus sp. 11-3]|uniref:Propionate 3-nitronate monooxygenase n=1 Tax=Paracoccus amoyensis TaxID=2760093 RepID=A0A926JCT7_9RHOB|nr:nitronate monooxygenase [Paracoccus amoyensis]MBC9246128.1 nitronate monooxygenase [Paracoccus amoyensis]